MLNPEAIESVVSLEDVPEVSVVRTRNNIEYRVALRASVLHANIDEALRR